MPVPGKRDAVDIARIDGLIPEAVSLANAAVKEDMIAGPAKKWSDSAKDKWNKEYHRSMDFLAKNEGLRF